MNVEESVQYTMLAERRSTDPSGAARFPMPAQNPDNGIEMEQSNQVHHEDAEEQEGMKDTITIECRKLNDKPFLGTVNFSEAKLKNFQDGLGLNSCLLNGVNITFNKCPVVTFKLHSKININLCIKNPSFSFTRFLTTFYGLHFSHQYTNITNYISS